MLVKKGKSGSWPAGHGALCWNKSVEQRSSTCISSELAQTLAMGLNCSPAGQGKKDYKGFVFPVIMSELPVHM